MKMLRHGTLALAGVLATTGSAHALTINLIDVNGNVAGTPAEQGFAIAARYWESVLTNNVTFNINVDFDDLGPNILGGTSTTLATFFPISQYYSALAASSNSTLDALAIANLRPLSGTGSVEVVVPDYLTGNTGVTGLVGDTRIAPDGQEISNTIALASSNYKALFGDAGIETLVDADIIFSSSFDFDFDPTDGIGVGQYDFIGVAVHEIGHALGFLSGVEDFDFVSGTGGFPVDDYWWGYSADLFRYSAEGTLDWTFGTDSYFSIDGGETPFLDGYWSTGSERGDGWQASHWKNPGNCEIADFRGIMNPYICDGVIDEVKALDLGLLDAIGWDTSVDALVNPGYTISTAQMYRDFFAVGAIPEPATWAMMIGGIGAIGGSLRRRRSVKVSFA